jgi:outer membrane protein TolC
VDSTKQARLYAEAALEAEQKKLENGKSTSFFVLQLQSDLTAARSAEIGALADYNKSLAQLALAEGATLERHRLQVGVK